MAVQQFLNYRIEKQLGVGETGTVYMAMHSQLNRRVAIKVLHPAYAKHAQIRERFKQEAAVMASLRHPSIVTVFDYVEQTEHLFLIMEYVEGITLEEYIHQENGPVEEARATEIYAQILDAFAYAHRRGVLHQHVRPSHILLTSEGKAKILDFGIARFFQDISPDLAPTGITHSSVSYMSPEQVQGKPVTKSSDVYALGVTFFEMLTGKVLFDTVELSLAEITNKIVNEPLPRMRSFNPGISYRMQTLVDRATAKDPEDRFQDGEQFKAYLLQAIAESHTIALPEVVEEKVTSLNAVPKPLFTTDTDNDSYPTYTPPVTNRRSRKGYWIALVVLLFLMVAGGVSWIYIKKPFKRTAGLVERSEIIEDATGDLSEEDRVHWYEGEVEEDEPVISVEEKATIVSDTKNTAKEKVKVVASDSIKPVASPTPAPDTANIPVQDVKSTLEQYYQALEIKDIDLAKSFYAPPLKRLFGEKNVSGERISELIEQSWERTPEDEHTIFWDTFTYHRDTEDNYVLDFWMNYTYQREGKGWRRRKLHTIIKMNPDLKIVYMTGN